MVVVVVVMVWSERYPFGQRCEIPEKPGISLILKPLCQLIF